MCVFRRTMRKPRMNHNSVGRIPLPQTNIARRSRNQYGARTVLRPQHIRRGRNGSTNADVPSLAARCGRGASAVRAERGRSSVRSTLAGREASALSTVLAADPLRTGTVRAPGHRCLAARGVRAQHSRSGLGAAATAGAARGQPGLRERAAAGMLRGGHPHPQERVQGRSEE